MAPRGGPFPVLAHIVYGPKTEKAPSRNERAKKAENTAVSGRFYLNRRNTVARLHRLSLVLRAEGSGLTFLTIHTDRLVFTYLSGTARHRGGGRCGPVGHRVMPVSNCLGVRATFLVAP